MKTDLQRGQKVRAVLGVRAPDATLSMYRLAPIPDGGHGIKSGITLARMS